MLPCSPKLEVREAIYHMCKNALASNKMLEAYAHRLISAKNGVAALRQEAFRADRHFSNASNKIFEAIITQLPAIHKQNGSTENGSIFEYSLFQKKKCSKKHFKKSAFPLDFFTPVEYININV